MTKETVLWTGPSLESALQTAHINLWHPLLPCSHGYSCTGGILGRGVSSQKEELLHAGRSFHPHTLAMVARQSSSDTVPIVPSCCPITGQHSNKVLCHALSCHSSSISQRTEHFWGAGKGNSNLSLSMNRAGGTPPLWRQFWLTGGTKGTNACRHAPCSSSPGPVCPPLHPGMPKGELGLLSILHGDLKFREPSPMAQNVCLDLLQKVPSPGAGHPFLTRSCCPPCMLPAQLGQGTRGLSERLMVPGASEGAHAQTDLLAGLEAATSTGKELQSCRAAGA